MIVKEVLVGLLLLSDGKNPFDHPPDAWDRARGIEGWIDFKPRGS